MSTITILFISLLILMAAYPLRNWLEIRMIKKQDLKWSNWLSEKPSRDEFAMLTNQNNDVIKCNFCGSHRHLPRLEKQIAYKPKFGFINNKIDMYSYFTTIICTGCGSQIYRERYEK
jgi:ribosomal protein S27E